VLAAVVAMGILGQAEPARSAPDRSADGVAAGAAGSLQPGPSIGGSAVSGRRRDLSELINRFTIDDTAAASRRVDLRRILLLRSALKRPV